MLSLLAKRREPFCPLLVAGPPPMEALPTGGECVAYAPPPTNSVGTLCFSACESI